MKAKNQNPSMPPGLTGQLFTIPELRHPNSSPAYKCHLLAVNHLDLPKTVTFLNKSDPISWGRVRPHYAGMDMKAVNAERVGGVGGVIGGLVL